MQEYPGDTSEDRALKFEIQTFSHNINSILNALQTHIEEQLKRYKDKNERYELNSIDKVTQYTALKNELQNLSEKLQPIRIIHQDEQEEWLSDVVNLLNKTAEVSQIRRNSFWDKIKQMMTGEKVEVKSWSSFKERFQKLKKDIEHEKLKEAVEGAVKHETESNNNSSLKL
ncbi:hypothetical protein [Legionella jamestowniensis]|uniref:Uncharacterized protein n=1 Tax=Legionella jamestowniensis TaxID=455 RepID=A0A0W0UUM9_9GAMM|nr:hypothetical protein [Legionella jamestowniensis]KTD11286.1 hypothetical protein Ljam_0480 [Legionella jamestowniensis]OCH98140.1 hypothetical protein A8135_13360 [Legionella jamestowniensis]SFL69548.1 hypothetical protein SAMN02746073_1433 [Legionella jamestowniensis DSM 19215]